MRQGLSPHGRGNRQPGHRDLPRHGSIPARAGKPSSLSLDRNRPWVYPRTGGETFLDVGQVFLIEGLSPHGRGNPPKNARSQNTVRSIPARAGKPVENSREPKPHRVYPRTGGETPCRDGCVRLIQGLSPHGRGNPIFPDARVLPIGSIPARAGKPSAGTVNDLEAGVYPRTGGETYWRLSDGDLYRGLSPHGRGNLGASVRSVGWLGSIPARAGKPRTGCQRPGSTRVYPRTGGETELSP